jgi:catechol 2,3-dioxygenase-like lactoylglutathione lyase family enzyme
MRLVSARIVTRDVAALARFYQGVTGVVPVGSDEYVELHTPGATLAISSARAMDLFGEGVATPSANRSVILDFEADDVDQERIRLDSIVADWILEPTTRPWGNRAALFRDPDGNLINVFTRPSSPVLCRGRAR